MTTPEIPHQFLRRDGQISPEDIQKLELQAESVQTDPIIGETVYNLGSREIWGGYPLIINVNEDEDEYYMDYQTHCLCRDWNHPLDCECNTVDCRKCGAEATALYIACDSEACLSDGCPACLHYREVCYTSEIIETIHSLAEEYLNGGGDEDDEDGDGESRWENTIAAAVLHAVTEALGASTGTAPIFPVTRRAISEYPRLKRQEGQDRNTVWTFEDGSALATDPVQGIWLEARA